MVASMLLCTALACAMPFDRGDQGGVLVSVVANGLGPFRFLIDTGATHTVVAPRLADRLGLVPVAQAAVGSSAGSAMAMVVRLASLRLGPVEALGVMPSLLPLDGIDPSATIDGVIGQDVLAPLRYTIDYRRRRILWLTPEAPMPGGLTLPLEPRHGRFVIESSTFDTALWLVPDSGASSLLLFADSRESMPRSVGSGGLALIHQPRSTLTTVSASVTAQHARLETLQLGERTLRDVAVVIVPTPVEPGGADGLLALHGFERVTFDGPGRTLVLE